MIRIADVADDGLRSPAMGQTTSENVYESASVTCRRLTSETSASPLGTDLSWLHATAGLPPEADVGRVTWFERTRSCADFCKWDESFPAIEIKGPESVRWGGNRVNANILAPNSPVDPLTTCKEVEVGRHGLPRYHFKVVGLAERRVNLLEIAGRHLVSGVVC